MQNNEQKQSGPTARVTVVTSIRPAVLSKTAAIGSDGTIMRAGGGQLAEGRVKIVGLSSLSGLAVLLSRLGPANALTFGVPRGGDGPVLSKALYQEKGAPQGATTRTRSAFVWPAGPGVMMLDHDSRDESLTRTQLVAAIRGAAPGLADAAMLWWPSASSHLCNGATGEDLTGLRGQRLYIMVSDAGDIPRAGAALVDRLWAAGHGRIVPSIAGAALERCLIDACVWQPERLDFAAGAVCEPPLEQRRGEPVIIEGASAITDTHTTLPDDAAIKAKADAARRRARTAAKDALASAREAYVESRVDKMVGPEHAEDGDRREAAQGAIRRAVDHGVLAADFPVEIEMAPGRFESVPIGRVLNDRQEFHGKLTRDPLEPDYDGGRATGKLFLLDARPTLFSFARGGRSFRLIRAPHQIEVLAGRMAEATEQVLELLRTDTAVFDHGGEVALVEGGQMIPLDEHALGHYLGGLVQFRRVKALKEGALGISEIEPPTKLVRQILSLGPRRRLKPLSAVITAPTLRADGSVLSTAGYDEQTGLLLDLKGAEPPEIPAAPDAKLARAALEQLMRPFRDFPLVDAHAWGALLAGLLTAVIRPSLLTAPGFAIDAPVQGSGKTLLACCIAALATGSAPEVWPHTAGRDDEEVRKRLFTALRDGTTALVWDNVTGIFDSAALASAITAPILRDRVLGRSESRGIPNRAMLLLTGNNLCPAGDLPRRLIPVRIDPGTDAPFTRQFDLDPLDHVLEHRQEMTVAALTLFRGAIASGRKWAKGRMASFETWDDLVRQTVAWVGSAVAPGEYGDPLELVLRAQASDPEQESLFALFEALTAVFPKMWFTAKDISQRAQRARGHQMATESEQALAEAIVDIAGERTLASTKSIGRMLKFRVGRVVLGCRLVSRPIRSGHEYRIEAVADPEPRGFDGFGGFGSGGSEYGSAPSRADTGNQRSGSSETNPPKPSNPQTYKKQTDWGRS